jgi:hypothetical protein
MKSRSDPRQLDLFRAEVIPFPFERRTSMVRWLTKSLFGKPDVDERTLHWNGVRDALKAEAAALGASPEDIQQNVFALRVACQCEARRLVHLAILRGEIVR